jgi:glycosyltransferase involved in cell wall biosynthesis
MKPKVTVVVTVKNSAGTIGQCIESVLKNKFSKDVVVVDAFSDDGTFEILEKFRRKKKIKLFRVRGNAATGLNYGIKMAKTPIIALTDADCAVDEKWLENLAGAIKGNYVASAGRCLTPKDAGGLSKTIGEEFDRRFDFEAEEVTRAPTMNLAFRKNTGILFDEKLDIAFETDFCFRLTKLGKIKYVRDALVYHNHRSTWRSFFTQQKNYGKYGALVYLRHASKVKGDHISRRRFFFQVGLLYILPVLFILGFFNRAFTAAGAVCAFLLAGLILYEVLYARPSRPAVFASMVLLRLLAWGIGGLEALFSCLRKAE